eukprot:5827465-Amphidinium_carterae.1
MDIDHPGFVQVRPCLCPLGDKSYTTVGLEFTLTGKSSTRDILRWEPKAPVPSVRHSDPLKDELERPTPKTGAARWVASPERAVRVGGPRSLFVLNGELMLHWLAWWVCYKLWPSWWLGHLRRLGSPRCPQCPISSPREGS